MDSNELLEQTLGTCTLQRLLGRGGMGAVYLARQSRPRRTVAVKVLMPGVFMEHQTSGEFLARFRREADAVAALDHINIMPIYEYGEQGDLAYLVMPYVAGDTLRQVLVKRPVLPLSEVLMIVDQAAAGLDSAHAQGIVHRDLKPGNILFHADGRLLLADFGLAKTIKEARESESSDRTALTSAGAIVGTPEYLSPEQGTGKPVDSRTDIYSLGVVIFQMLAGRVPFQGNTPVAVAIKHALEEPPSLIELNPEVPPTIEAVVRKAIAKNPAERYASAGELARALRHAAMQIHATPRTLEALEAATGPIKLSATPDAVLPELHNALTEENPRLPGPSAPVFEELQSTSEAAMVPTDEGSTLIVQGLAPVLPKRDRRVMSPLMESRRAMAYRPESGKPRSRRAHPVPMMLLGSLITLLIVASILGSILYLGQQGLHKPAYGVGTHTPSTTGITPGHTPSPLPALLVPAGPLLYGTNLPGPQCDINQDAKWSKTANANLRCNNNVTTLSSSGGDQLAGIYLDALPDKTYPNDYIIQIQVDVDSSSYGPFGIFFRHQQGGGFIYLLDPAGTYKSAVYSGATGGLNPLFSGAIIQGRLSNTVTIDVAVQGNTYVLFINGVRQGGAISAAYTQGNVGLAAPAGSNVHFKNFALYAYQ